MLDNEVESGSVVVENGEDLVDTTEEVRVETSGMCLFGPSKESKNLTLL